MGACSSATISRSSNASSITLVRFIKDLSCFLGFLVRNKGVDFGPDTVPRGKLFGSLVGHPSSITQP